MGGRALRIKPVNERKWREAPDLKLTYSVIHKAFRSCSPIELPTPGNRVYVLDVRSSEGHVALSVAEGPGILALSLAAGPKVVL